MADRYNYLAAVKEDVRQAIAENYTPEDYRGNRDGLEEELNDQLWIDDSVTGNASGSYYCNAWKAEEALAHNLDLIAEVAAEFGIEPTVSDGYEHGAEWWDVTIRCYYLGQAIAEVLDEFEENGVFDEEEDDEPEQEEAGTLDRIAAAMKEGFTDLADKAEQVTQKKPESVTA